MNITFNKQQVQLNITNLPVGTNKVKISIPAYEQEFAVIDILEIGNYQIDLTATVQAVKVTTEEVTSVDPETQEVTTQISNVETVIETQLVNLHLL